MATAKKSAKSKKTAATKKSSAAQAKSKKTVAKKATNKSKKPSNRITVERIFKFNLVAAFTTALMGVLSVVLLSDKSESLSYSYFTKDELASTSETVLGQAHNIFVNFEIRYILAAIFGITAVYFLLLATLFRKKYEDTLNQKVSVFRWVLLGISAGALIQLVSLVGGVQDVVTLKMAWALIFVTCLLGWVSESFNKNKEKNYTAFYLSLLTGVLAWVPLVVSLIATTVKGMEYFDWQVYALALVLLIGFVSFAVTQYRYIKNGADAQKFLSIEGQYLSSVLLLNLATFVLFFSALY